VRANFSGGHEALFSVAMPSEQKLIRHTLSFCMRLIYLL
jgi:hypothetical protein